MVGEAVGSGEPEGSGVGMELGTGVGTAVGVSEGAGDGGLVGTDVGSGVGHGVLTNWQQAESVSPSPWSVKVRTSRLPVDLIWLALSLPVLSPESHAMLGQIWDGADVGMLVGML